MVGGRIKFFRPPPRPTTCALSPAVLSVRPRGITIGGTALRARIMSSVPLLSARQWRAIEPHLPPNRRDRVLISAILFRETEGAGIRDVCELFGVTRTRL